MLSTRAWGQAFLDVYYRRTTRWTVRPPLLESLPDVPPTYDSQLIGIRLRLGLTQAELAAQIGAAGKAVVYQWESRKRKPSPVLWSRVLTLLADPPSRE